MKTILISSDSNDNSTDDVLTWIYHSSRKIFIRKMFDKVKLENIKIELSNKRKLDININNIKINNFTNYWYRRGELIFESNIDSKYGGIHKRLIDENINPILNFANGLICDIQKNKYNDNFKEKLEMLQICLDLNLNIPDVLITSRSDDLREFLTLHKKIITKPVKNPSIRFKIESFKLSLSTSTKLLTTLDIPGNNIKFLPSFFQKYIDKKFEIRTFYLNGIFKSMVIFSQENEKTKIDFRNYDYERPNRCVPYSLPKSLEKKLHKLMVKLHLNSGSFDLIYTPSGKYYFLEVNPIGQFQWLSKNCNYYIERLIAHKLLE